MPTARDRSDRARRSPHPAEVVADNHHSWPDPTAFPAIVDRPAPDPCVVVRDEVPKFDGGRSRERRSAQSAADTDL
jgi:hypothetical protein